MENKGIELQSYLQREDVVLSLTILLLLLSTVLFGGVHEYSKNLAFFIAGLTFFLLGEGRKINLTLLLTIPFLLWLFIQLIPLPLSTLSLVSDKRVEVATTINGLIEETVHFSPLTYSPYLTFKELLLHATAFVGALALYRVLDRRRLMVFLYFIIALALVEALYGIYQFVMQYPGVLWEKSHFAGTARGTFINRNHFAGFLELAVFFLIGYMLSLGKWEENISLKNLVSSEHLHRQIVMLSMSATVITALLLSLSRGGIISFAGAMVFFIALIGLRLKLYRREESSRQYYGTLLLLSLAVVLMSWASIGYIQSRFARAGEDAHNRVSVWLDSLTGIKEHPVFGTGGGTFEYAYYMYKDRNRENLIYEHAHNDYIEYAVETGIVGAMLFFAPFLWFLVSGTKRLMRMSLKRESLEFFTLLACLAGIFSLIIHSFVDFNLQIPANLYLAYALLGVGGAIIHDRPALSYTARD